MLTCHRDPEPTSCKSISTRSDTVSQLGTSGSPKSPQLHPRGSNVVALHAQQEDITRDLVAVGYRRKQLRNFEALLQDERFFAGERERLQCRPEDVWQKFFEANTWIFGYGLSYQFLSKLDQGKLEKIVRGHDLTGAAKRSDALMKTRGIIGSLCFIEIKRHDQHRHCERSEAIHLSLLCQSGLLRCARNDVDGFCRILDATLAATN